MIHEERERDAQAPVDDSQPPRGVGEVQVAGDLYQGDHERVERDHHRGDAQQEHEPAVTGPRAGKLEPGDRGKEHDARRSHAGDEKRVEKEIRVAHQGKCIDEVFPVQPGGECNHVRRDFRECLQGIDDHEEQRVEIDHRAERHDQGDRQGAPRPFPDAHAWTSRRLNAVSWKTVTPRMSRNSTTDFALP